MQEDLPPLEPEEMGEVQAGMSVSEQFWLKVVR